MLLSEFFTCFGFQARALLTWVSGPDFFRGSLWLARQDSLLPVSASGGTVQIKQQFLEAELFKVSQL